MESARFLFEYEQEKKVEQRAMAEMKKTAPTVSKLGRSHLHLWCLFIFTVSQIRVVP
jgi:hypothetical protein